MGAVNRCWRCGKLLVAHSGPQDIPPVRRDPITGPLDSPLEATVLAETVPAETTVRAQTMEPSMRGAPRRGSPFAPNTATLRVAGPIPEPILVGAARPRLPRTYESQFAAQVAAGVALVLGVIANGISFRIPIAAVCLALFVLGFGTWGLFGKRRGVAILGLILGCMALAWGGFGTAVQAYQLMYGVHPFAVSPQLPPSPTSVP